MNPQSEEQVISLYAKWTNAWNSREASSMAELLTSDASFITFDGSLLTGPYEVKERFTEVFASYPTAESITIVKEVRFLSPDVALLRADTGMVAREGVTVNSRVNAIQVATMVRKNARWQIAHLQNTPAASPQMTVELQSVFDRRPRT